jgi:beta-glucosidase
VDELLEAGIEPFPTLYHWDLPQALEERGGWTNRTTAEEFARYAELVVSRLGDRVQRWTTHNEPRIAAWLGYGWGEHAPGRCNADDAIAAAHHLLLSHGWAARRIRSVRQDAEVGIALSLTAIEPQSNLPEDAEAAGRRDATVNRWCLDPLFRGRYPDQCLGDLGGRPPPVRDGDLTAIAARLDFIGVNYYTREVVRCGSGGRPITVRDPASPRTEMGWEIYPRGLTEMLLRLHEEYRPRAIYVTENGAAFPDSREGDGSVQDSARCSYLGDHLDALAQAVSAGVPVRGYFAWSLLDNFEWAHGYSKRFGLVYVDYKTLAKTPKASFHWYRNLIATERARPYAT